MRIAPREEGNDREERTARDEGKGMRDEKHLNAQRPTLNAYRLPLLAIVLFAVAARLYLLITTHRTVEDYFITLRYAENIARGVGFVYNPGEHVLGTTTPLYTLYLALVSWLGLNTTLWGQGLNILADGLSCILLFRLGRAIGRPEVGLLAATVLAIWPPNLLWAISGMETSCVTVSGLATFVAFVERRAYLMACSAAALVLLRVDGLLLVTVAFVAFGLWERRERSRLQLTGCAFAMFVLLILPWTLFAWRYFGSPIPTSLTAKLAVYGWQSRSAFPNAVPFVREMTHNSRYLLLLIGALPGLWFAVIRYPLLRPAALWLVIYYTGMALSKAFLFGWYYVPPTPIYFFLSMLGWTGLVSLLWDRLSKRRDKGPGYQPLAAMVSLVIGALLLVGGIGLAPQRSLILQAQEEDERLLKPIGLALREIVSPDEKVMMEPIGWIGYYSQARILDAVGLVSPEIIPSFRKGAVSPYLDLMAELKPEYVLLRTGEYQDARVAHVPPDRALDARYTLVRTFDLPGASSNTEPAFFLFRRK